MSVFLYQGTETAKRRNDKETCTFCGAPVAGDELFVYENPLCIWSGGEQQVKSFQERLLKDFDIKQKMVNGRMKNVYVYKGKYVAWDVKPDMLQRFRRIHLGGGILALLLLLWGAFQSVPVNASHLTGFFTLVSCVLMAVLFYGIVWFCRSGERMYLRDCRMIRDIILWSGITYALAAAANGICGFIYLAINGAGVRSLLTLLAYLASGVIVLLVYLAQLKLAYREV